MSLLCATAISLYASEPPGEQITPRTIESTIKTIKTLYSHLDTEVRRLGEWTKIPAAITSFLALFATIRRILPDKRDYIIPVLAAAGAAYVSYRYAPTVASWVLTKKPMMETVTPKVAPAGCLPNMASANQLLGQEQQALIDLHVPQEQLLAHANKLNDHPRARQLLIGCLPHNHTEVS